MFDRARGENVRAPGSVIGIEHAGKMHTAPGGRAFARQHAIAHNGERIGGRVAAGGFGYASWLNGFRLRGGHSHSHTSQFSFLFWSMGVNEWLTIRNRDRSISTWLLIGRRCSRVGSRNGDRG